MPHHWPSEAPLVRWDLFCRIGHRRFARHWSVPQIRAKLLDSRQIGLSGDAIEDALRNYLGAGPSRQGANAQQSPRITGDRARDFGISPPCR